MKRTSLLLAALAGAALLTGCVGFVPAPVAVDATVVHGGPVVHPGPVIVQPAPVYVRPGPGPRGWRGDRDGDGVPNRYDRRPGNPYRY